MSGVSSGKEFKVINTAQKKPMEGILFESAASHLGIAVPVLDPGKGMFHSCSYI